MQRTNINDRDTVAYKIAQFVKEHSRTDECIFVWGWHSRVNVYSGRRSAAAAIVNNTIVQTNRYPRKNLENFLSDISRNRPRLIVDAVFPKAFRFNKPEQSLENNKDVWPTLEKHYTLFHELPINDTTIKIYKRID